VGDAAIGEGAGLFPLSDGENTGPPLGAENACPPPDGAGLPPPAMALAVAKKVIRITISIFFPALMSLLLPMNETPLHDIS
jgi:hypothetical protein